jgi:hypothetical protein
MTDGMIGRSRYPLDRFSALASGSGRRSLILGSRDGRDTSEAPRATREVARPVAEVKRDDCLHVPQGAAVPKRRDRAA